MSESLFTCEKIILLHKNKKEKMSSPDFNFLYIYYMNIRIINRRVYYNLGGGDMKIVYIN